MNYGLIILVICIIVFMTAIYRKTTCEHMETGSSTSLTDIDIEALQNLSSMYNTSTDTVTVTNLQATGDVTVTGNAKVSGILAVNEIDPASDLNVGGNLNVTGTGTITGDLNVSGTTKTTGPTYSKYYVINSRDSNTSDLKEIYNLVTPSNTVNGTGNRTAAGVIYANSGMNLGIKTGSHIYLTTYGSQKMIDILGDTVDYYPNTKTIITNESGKDGLVT
jgi:hypothetical protein